MGMEMGMWMWMWMEIALVLVLALVLVAAMEPAMMTPDSLPFAVSTDPVEVQLPG